MSETSFHDLSLSSRTLSNFDGSKNSPPPTSAFPRKDTTEVKLDIMAFEEA